ncbi:MAG: hypothetical protein UR28_C0022G0020 [Candidatus Peregrinibacteria bacterium GW2011_GWF2_33_10]|nr:MAG: hypothetical protein UR28_C0022G0020 [Candidatus Peregrinibacteria bacterium GW2011_GWF2_33_10]OGJ44317.1 MAG: hypothetical protein A2263_05505 [Candidatus Peregrinibacteria bacterium RIFOXYA2_FULL_33_21]OGJ46521.1 MAG: hypothetical protein A2272_01375 [Candidatus Peregrinibacteria bacterium RIFOXYA12_FULL_33_12]OGJ50559.1 MAG: hypothetical protein A2307_03230 [Candidatus Peregrinibacteria bacterium RIFOXYB2_FULL_33_20]
MSLSDFIDLNSLPTHLQIKVIPKSNKTEFVDVLFPFCHSREGGNLNSHKEVIFKIRLKAVPEKGKANKELIKFLSKELHISKSNISIISGETDTLKLIKISSQ